MKRVLFLLVMLTASISVNAQQVDSLRRESDIEQLTDRVNKESEKIRKIDKWIDALPKFSGYLQAGYTWNQDNAVDISTFKVNRLRLILAGDISKMFDYKLQFEGFSNSVDQQKKALVTVLDAFIRAKIHPSLYVQVGQFPISLSIENYDLSPGTIEFISFSSVVNRMVTRNAITGFANYGRDAGVMLTGSFLPKDGYSLLSYNFALLNGSQLNQPDNNKSKDIVARLTVQPYKNFRVSGSVNWGEYSSSITNGKYIGMTRYVVGGYYESSDFIARSEFGHQYSKVGRVKESMYYVMAGYNFNYGLTPLVRYDVFDNLNMDEGKETNLGVGLLYRPLKNLRVQANYTYSIYEMESKKGGQKFELVFTGFF